jgi:hypothetical protein
VFVDPAVLRGRRFKQLEYLDDDTVSPLPFRRLVERDPDKASTVFAKLLRRPGFDCGRDGEALMRQRKAAYFDNPVQPSITPLGERVVSYLSQG